MGRQEDVNVVDMVDDLLSGLAYREDDGEEKVAEESQQKLASEDFEKAAEYLDFMAEQMEKAAAVSPESLIPPSEKELGNEIQQVTGINKNEAARVMQEAKAEGAGQVTEDKIATSPEEVRATIPEPTSCSNKTMESCTKEAKKLLVMSALGGKWPAPVEKRTAE